MKKTVTYDEFVKVLQTAPAGIITLSTITEPKMKKGGTKGTEPNPYYDNEVRKHKRAQYQFGKNYVEAINENLAKEGKAPVNPDNFDKLPWGEFEIVDRVIKHNDSRYLRCYQDDNSVSVVSYTLDGKNMTPEEYEKLKPYLPTDSSISKKQEDAGLSAENQVRPLLFKFDNIEEAEIDGITYTIAK